MNKTLVLVCLAIIGFIGWKERDPFIKWKDQVVGGTKKLASPHDGDLADDQGKEPTTADNGAKEPPSAKPAAPATVAVQAPEPVRLPEPPEGVYYLTERFKLVTDLGIKVYRPGLEVKKLSETGSDVSVSDGKDTFTVPASKLTRDMALVLSIQKAEHDSAAAATAAASPKTAQVIPVKAGPPPDPNAGAKAQLKAEMEYRRTMLQDQIASYDRQIAQYNQQINTAESRASGARSVGRMSAAGASVGYLQDEVKKVMAARQSAVNQLTALGR